MLSYNIFSRNVLSQKRLKRCLLNVYIIFWIFHLIPILILYALFPELVHQVYSLHFHAEYQVIIPPSIVVFLQKYLYSVFSIKIMLRYPQCNALKCISLTLELIKRLFFLSRWYFENLLVKSEKKVKKKTMFVYHIKDDYVIFHENSSLRCKVLSFSAHKNLFLLLRTRNELKTSS